MLWYRGDVEAAVVGDWLQLCCRHCCVLGVRLRVAVVAVICMYIYIYMCCRQCCVLGVRPRVAAAIRITAQSRVSCEYTLLCMYAAGTAAYSACVCVLQLLHYPYASAYVSLQLLQLLHHPFVSRHMRMSDAFTLVYACTRTHLEDRVGHALPNLKRALREP